MSTSSSPDLASLDALELELRQLPGVFFVAFSDREDVLVVQVGAEEAEGEQLRARATQLASGRVERPVVVEVVGTPDVAGSGRRVRLLAALTLPDGEVEVHLTLGDRRTIGRRHGDDLVTAAAGATLDALQALGLPAPFQAVWTRPVADGGAGLVAVSLHAPSDGGHRYGIAAADDPVTAAARATLHALNRSLSGRKTD